MAKTNVKENKDAGAEVAKKEGLAVPTPAPRRAPGQKEVIPFEWKVCGYSSDGHTLTLFKSIEQADAEAQLARLIAEGYYDGLKLYGVDDRVPESAKAKKIRLAVRKRTRRSGEAATAKTTKSTSASRKAAKTPNVVTTAMGKMVDGRITVRRKKTASSKAADKVAATKAGARKSTKARSGVASKKKAKAAAKSPRKPSRKKKAPTAAAKKRKAPARKKARPKTAGRKASRKTARKKSVKKPVAKGGKKPTAIKKKKPSSGKRTTVSRKR